MARASESPPLPGSLSMRTGTAESGGAPGKPDHTPPIRRLRTLQPNAGGRSRIASANKRVRSMGDAG